MTFRKEFHPGFQGSRTTGCIVRVHSSGGDPILRTKPSVITFDGRANTPQSNPAVVAVNTSKGLGQASGAFTVQVRVPDSWGRTEPSLFNRIVDDDWLDIVFTINGRETHVMRGQIDSIRENKSAGGEGNPTRVYTITGRDFGRILEMTPVWFNVFRAENAAGDLTLKAFDAFQLGGQPNRTVKRIVFGFLETLTGLQRANWPLPSSLNSGANFIQALNYDDLDFDPDPVRQSISTQFENPGGAPIWNLAQEWSDPMFCELIADLGPLTGRYFFPDEEYDTDQTEMRLTFRNKPSPTWALGPDRLW